MAVSSFFQHLPWITISGLLGNAISFMVFLSPVPTFYRIWKKKSTEGFQVVPYVVALFSAILWLFYAFVKGDATFLITINSFGCFIETIYIIMFLVYGTKEAKMATMKLMLLMNVFGFGAVLFIVLVITKGAAARLRVLGWICLIFALCVFVAPLGVMGKVIRTKSVKYMPFFLSFFLTISAVMWFFYGLLRKDYYVAIPNVLGFTFGIAQMILYAIYRKAKPVEDDVELGQKQISTDQIIEAVKLHGTTPMGTPQRIIPTSTATAATTIHLQPQQITTVDFPNMQVHHEEEPMDQKMMNKAGVNHAAPWIAVAV